jgi:hypothetical protein
MSFKREALSVGSKSRSLEGREFDYRNQSLSRKP